MRKVLLVLLLFIVLVAFVSTVACGNKESPSPPPSLTAGPGPAATAVPPPADVPTAIPPAPWTGEICQQQSQFRLGDVYCLQGDGSTNKSTPCTSPRSAIPLCATPIR